MVKASCLRTFFYAFIFGGKGMRNTKYELNYFLPCKMKSFK
jgi:hypothetical protein